jgi:DNA-binding SARP family transcriptional activator
LVGGRRRNGYSLAVDADEVDASLAGGLARAGAAALAGGDPWQPSPLLRQASPSGTAPPYADLSDELPLPAEIARLTERHLTTLEHRIEADLQRRQHLDLVDELLVLVDQHPYRERFGAQLTRVLYRAGRRAEALATYQRVRNALQDQFGLEPGAELRRLQRVILVGARAPST